MQKRNALAVSALALMMAAPLHAQGALTGVDGLDDRIDDLQEDINDDLTQADRRDRYDNQYAQGWSGSVAAGFSTTSGNTDTADLDIAGRLRYGSGPWNHTFGFAAEFSETNGTRDEEEYYGTYDVNRYISKDVYLFGLASARYDKFDTNKVDAFLGFGPGVRVINTPQAQLASASRPRRALRRGSARQRHHRSRGHRVLALLLLADRHHVVLDGYRRPVLGQRYFRDQRRGPEREDLEQNVGAFLVPHRVGQRSAARPRRHRQLVRRVAGLRLLSQA